MEDDLKMIRHTKNLFSIPLKFRANLSWDWLSSLRFLQYINMQMFPPDSRPPNYKASKAMQPHQFRGKGMHVHVRILRPRSVIWIISSYRPIWPETEFLPVTFSLEWEHTIVYTLSTNKTYRLDTVSRNIILLKEIPNFT